MRYALALLLLAACAPDAPRLTWTPTQFSTVYFQCASHYDDRGLKPDEIVRYCDCATLALMRVSPSEEGDFTPEQKAAASRACVRARPARFGGDK